MSPACLAYIEKRAREKAEKKGRVTPAKRVRYTPKQKAQYAIEQRAGDKWMQKWIDFDDKSIPVGKRRVAYVRYLTMVKHVPLDIAKGKSLKVIKI